MPVLSSIVSETKIYTAHNRTDDEITYDETLDKVFILSEADVLGTANKVSTTESKEYTLSSKTTLASKLPNDNTAGYWYRSPATVDLSSGGSTYRFDANMRYLNSANKTQAVKTTASYQNKGYVRPAMCVSLEG